MFREKKNAYLHAQNSIFLIIMAKKKKRKENPLEISYFLGLKITLLGSGSIGVWAQSQVHLVYAYKLMCKMPALKCMSPNRKPLVAGAPVFRAPSSTSTGPSSPVPFRGALCSPVCLSATVTSSQLTADLVHVSAPIFK